jgi:hypothetical protein
MGVCQTLVSLWCLQGQTGRGQEATGLAVWRLVEASPHCGNQATLCSLLIEVLHGSRSQGRHTHGRTSAGLYSALQLLSHQVSSTVHQCVISDMPH